MDRAERIRAGIWGLLVGDALGVPYEFHDPASIPPAAAIELAPPAGFRRAHPSVPPGTWSDDGAQALCLLASLLHRRRMDPDDLMRRLIDWHDLGYMAVGGIVFDVGITTGQALAAFRRGVPALEAGPSDEHSNGNGSLMRVLPLALWHRGSDAELAADAQLQSRVTHGHVRARVCCALYCLWARRILNGAPDAWAEAVAALRAIHDERSEERRELEEHVRPDDAPSGRGTGYVVDCLRSARLVLEAGPYESVVRAAIRFGHDTDTTAAVAGGLAGLRDGLDGIPARWRERMRASETFVPMLESLVSLVG